LTLLAGLALAVCGLVGVFTLAAEVAGRLDGSAGWSLLVGRLAFPSLILSAWLLVLGVTGIFGHAEVELRPDRLRVIERCGFLHWSRAVRIERIRQFRTQSSRRGPAQMEDRFGKLAVEIRPGRWKTLVSGYPVHWLQGLADQLRGRLTLPPTDSVGLTTQGEAVRQERDCLE
jgi:hypothetical protein